MVDFGEPQPAVAVSDIPQPQPVPLTPNAPAGLASWIWNTGPKVWRGSEIDAIREFLASRYPCESLTHACRLISCWSRPSSSNCTREAQTRPRITWTEIQFATSGLRIVFQAAECHRCRYQSIKQSARRRLQPLEVIGIRTRVSRDPPEPFPKF